MTARYSSEGRRGSGVRTAAGTGMVQIVLDACYIVTVCLSGVGRHMCAQVNVWRSEDKLATLLLSCHLMPIAVGSELGLTGLPGGAELSAGQE